MTLLEVDLFFHLHLAGVWQFFLSLSFKSLLYRDHGSKFTSLPVVIFAKLPFWHCFKIFLSHWHKNQHNREQWIFCGGCVDECLGKVRFPLGRSATSGAGKMCCAPFLSHIITRFLFVGLFFCNRAEWTFWVSTFQWKMWKSAVWAVVNNSTANGSVFTVF